MKSGDSTNYKFSINEVILEEYFKCKKGKSLYIYAATAMVCAGKGYITKKEFIKSTTDLCKISDRTALRWIKKMEESNLYRIRKGMIHPIGRKSLESEYATTKRYLQFTEHQMRSFSDFQYHTIRQMALLLQKRFKYAWQHLNANDTTSLIKTGKIETSLARMKSRKQVGCSISKVQEKLGVAKSTIAEALKGYTMKQENCTYPIKGGIARKKYGTLLDDIANRDYKYISPKWSFRYNSENDTYRICYSLPSIIQVSSFLKSKRKSNNHTTQKATTV